MMLCSLSTPVSHNGPRGTTGRVDDVLLLVDITVAVRLTHHGPTLCRIIIVAVRLTHMVQHCVA